MFNRCLQKAGKSVIQATHHFQPAGRRLSRKLQQLRGGLRVLVGNLYGVSRCAGLLLRPRHQFSDLLCASTSSFRELPHFVSYDGKAATMCPGMCGFDSGIRREQPALIRDIFDQFENPADLSRRLRRFATCFAAF